MKNAIFCVECGTTDENAFFVRVPWKVAAGFVPPHLPSYYGAANPVYCAGCARLCANPETRAQIDRKCIESPDLWASDFAEIVAETLGAEIL